MKYLLLIIALLFAEGSVKAQSIDSVRIARICDSTLIVNTSIDFFNHVKQYPNRIARFDYIPINANYNPSRINDQEYISQFVESKYNSGYELRLPNGDAFLLREDTTKEVQSWGAPNFGFKLNMDFTILETPDYKLLKQLYSSIHNLNKISKDSACLIAHDYFSIKGNKYHDPILEYEAQTGVFYWRMSKWKGQRTIKEEQVFINAETGEFSEVIEMEYPVRKGHCVIN